jgi:hypothetical protein
MDENYKEFSKESIENIMRNSKSLYSNKLGKEITALDMKNFSNLESEYFKTRMHEKLNLDEYIIFYN